MYAPPQHRDPLMAPQLPPEQLAMGVEHRSPGRSARYTLVDLLRAEPSTVSILNSPRSREVCRRHGILPQELYPRSAHSFQESRDEPIEIVRRRYDHFMARRQEKIEFLLGERQRMIQLEAQAAGPGIVDFASVGSRTLDVDAYAFDARARKEVLNSPAPPQYMSPVLGDQRSHHSALSIEEQKLNEAVLEAEKKAQRRELAMETQKRQEEMLMHKRDVLGQKEEERQRAIEDRRLAEMRQREEKREQHARRTALIKQRKGELERSRIMQLESRMQYKTEKTLDFERDRTQSQLERQFAVEKKFQRESNHLKKVQDEEHRRQLLAAERALMHEDGGTMRFASERRAAEYHAKQEEKTRRIQEVKQRNKELEEVKRLQVLTKLQEKEARQQQAQEERKQQQLWGLNEKKIREMDAKEAIERQKRREAYELEIKQKQLQTKMERLFEAEETKWRVEQEKRMRLDAIRPMPGTPRLGASAKAPSSAGGRRRSRSCGTTRGLIS
ncbi:Reticulocyte-binding protein 2-like protein a [Diplonema papillatum]|nr:Reticulocyte-binding protein 2-like protein a [Diplonema papillatum]